MQCPVQSQTNFKDDQVAEDLVPSVLENLQGWRLLIYLFIGPCSNV